MLELFLEDELRFMLEVPLLLRLLLFLLTDPLLEGRLLDDWLPCGRTYSELVRDGRLSLGEEL